MITTVNTAVPVDVYCDEFKPLLKLINRALLNSEFIEQFTEDEVDKLYNFKDDFSEIALEFAT